MNGCDDRDQGDCGQAQTASSTSSVVPSEHVKWLLRGRDSGQGRAGRALGLKGDTGGDGGWMAG